MLGCASAWSAELETPEFILDTSGLPVTLSVIEISSAVGAMPAPLAACVAVRSLGSAWASCAGKEM